MPRVVWRCERSSVCVNIEIGIEGQKVYFRETLDDWHETPEMILKMPPDIRAEIANSVGGRVETQYSLLPQAFHLLKTVVAGVR